VFVAQPAKEKRSLLNFVLSNSTWPQGKLSVEFKESFDVLAQTVEAATRVEATEGAASARNEVWLGGLGNDPSRKSAEISNESTQ